MATHQKNRLIAAALRVAAAERGGLDGEDNEHELSRSSALLDDAVRRYHETLDAPPPTLSDASDAPHDGPG